MFPLPVPSPLGPGGLLSPLSPIVIVESVELLQPAMAQFKTNGKVTSAPPSHSREPDGREPDGRESDGREMPEGVVAFIFESFIVYSHCAITRATHERPQR